MHCVAAPDRSRVLAGRHQDDCGAPDCPGCLPCPQPHCATCHTQHADATCAECLALARHNLTALGRLHQHLEAEARHGRHATHVHTGIPGGDAVVLLVPGPSPQAYGATLAQRLAQELDVSHAGEEYRQDPRPVLTVLVEWEARWRAKMGTPTTLPRTMPRVVDYLGEQLHHIAQDPATFPTLAREVATTLRRVEDVLHEGQRPQVSRVPCLGCGTRLAKRYGDTEAADHWVCPRCGEVYDRGRYDRAKHDHLASAGAERYVAVSDAVAAIGRPRTTVWNWVRKGLVQARRDPTRGTMVWWPDVRELHVATRTRTRRTTQQPNP